MKNKTILLGMALAIFATLFTSCQKEDFNPTPIQEIETNNLLMDPDIVTLTDPDLEPQGLVSFPITVTSSPCSTGGYTLIVTSPDVDLSDGNFTINWYKNTEQEIYFEGQELECVCGFGVRVEVIDETGSLAADDSLDIPGC
ncbi:MAG: hypothetical protein AB8F94_25955 [Saprospiraceae bacterium]